MQQTTKTTTVTMPAMNAMTTTATTTISGGRVTAGGGWSGGGGGTGAGEISKATITTNTKPTAMTTTTAATPTSTIIMPVLDANQLAAVQAFATQAAAVAASSVRPNTPDSAGVLVSAAGNMASERRNKTIMNCFRDRTPSYSRSNSRLSNPTNDRIPVTNTTTGGGPTAAIKSQTQTAAQNSQRDIVISSPLPPPDTVVYMKEPRVRTNILTLMKSTSSRDLHNYIQEESNTTTSTFSSTSSASPPPTQLPIRRREVACQRTCLPRIKELEQRVAVLEKELQQQCDNNSKLQAKLNELSKVVEDMNSSKLEKRKKSVRKKPTINNNVQPSKLTAWMNLSNLWKHRPTIETLKQQNIYNDEPCFDTEIEMVLKHEMHVTVPKIVVDCCDLIEEQYRKSPMPIEGIYRQCGDYNRIQTLRFSIDANDYAALRSPQVDIHVLTGVLKLFLREIKSPLVSANEAKTFMGKPNQWLLLPLKAKIDTLKRLILSLPEVNRDTADYLFAHFNRLTKVPLQQISAETLSISVTPSIFHTVQAGGTQDIHVLLKESEILADSVKIMIEYHHRIFGCIADERRTTRCISVRRLKKTLSHPDLIFQNFF